MNNLQHRKVILQWMSAAKVIRDACAVFDLKKNIYTARRISGLDSKVVTVPNTISARCLLLYYISENDPIQVFGARS